MANAKKSTKWGRVWSLCFAVFSIRCDELNDATVGDALSCVDEEDLDRPNHCRLHEVRIVTSTGAQRQEDVLPNRLSSTMYYHVRANVGSPMSALAMIASRSSNPMCAIARARIGSIRSPRSVFRSRRPIRKCEKGFERRFTFANRWVSTRAQ